MGLPARLTQACSFPGPCACRWHEPLWLLLPPAQASESQEPQQGRYGLSSSDPLLQNQPHTARSWHHAACSALQKGFSLPLFTPTPVQAHMWAQRLGPGDMACPLRAGSPCAPTWHLLHFSSAASPIPTNVVSSWAHSSAVQQAGRRWMNHLIPSGGPHWSNPHSQLALSRSKARGGEQGPITLSKQPASRL